MLGPVAVELGWLLVGNRGPAGSAGGRPRRLSTGRRRARGRGHPGRRAVRRPARLSVRRARRRRRRGRAGTLPVGRRGPRRLGGPGRPGLDRRPAAARLAQGPRRGGRGGPRRRASRRPTISAGGATGRSRPPGAASSGRTTVSARRGEVPAREDDERRDDRDRGDRAEHDEVGRIRQAGQDGLRVEVVEDRVGWRPWASGHSDPRTSRKYDTATKASVRPSAGDSRSNDGRGEQADRADRPVQQRAVEPQQRQAGRPRARRCARSGPPRRASPRSSRATAIPTNSAPQIASVAYSTRREIGRDSRTSSVPRWRSPAMAAVAKPTANTRLRPTAIGWMKPSATEPLSEKMSPPPNWANCGGMRAAVEDVLELPTRTSRR